MNRMTRRSSSTTLVFYFLTSDWQATLSARLTRSRGFLLTLKIDTSSYSTTSSQRQRGWITMKLASGSSSSTTCRAHHDEYRCVVLVAVSSCYIYSMGY
ncbi:hypothetical protein C8R45DRAFT_1012658 [Mycena sanguinolenta]|nr:hypothetical protein C8R45DRAFT_1012658 [Mycena sanguinolenta]